MVMGVPKLVAAAAGGTPEARRYAEASLAYLKEAAEGPNATVQQLVEVVRVLLDPAVKTLRDYPLALQYALRANALAKGKDLAALVYLAESYWRNGNAPAAVETARKALAMLPAAGPGESSSNTRRGLEESLAEYEKGARGAAR
jgi:tetratricopeptide (TPR) repeat protein